MKKWLSLLISLTLCLALSACGGKDSISGEVVEVTPTALILETSNGKREAVLIEKDTLISGMEGLDGDDYKANPHTGVIVLFFPKGRTGFVTASDGTKVKAYHANFSIRVSAYLVPNIAVLSDGTVLDAWKTDSFGIIYQTEDGVELLREEPPSDPENYYVGNLESFDNLSETAKPRVTEFYENQGKLYDLQAELERAWTAYKADPTVFSSFWVNQHSYPSASSERVFYFNTSLTQTISGNMVQDTTLCTAFDRETGANIPLSDLFVCPEKDIGKKLLELAETGDDPAVKAEMETAFRIEFLHFSQDSLWVEFPQGSLPSEENAYLVSVELTEDCKALLQPWAVPHHNANDF